ncbi:MAG TPA: methionine--tRNA ligase [Vineibacter sp.]|nr:methionine--tRNA ligase [Vineibacter sp.]
MTRILITSALPYINGVKHLGNLAGSILPADIHARYHRQVGHETLLLCGTDEHGTPAELAAAAAGVDVAAYCAAQHAIQADIYRRFGIAFDHFSRSSGPANHALTRHLFERLEAAGLIEERSVRQAYSPTDGRFLPDRYLLGTCPRCGDPGARGDQCEACTAVLDPGDLLDRRSAISGARDIEFRETRHLFLKLSALQRRLRHWIEAQSGWSALTRSIALKWLDEGLRDRCITRDLAWGVSVPRPGFEGKVFYVWFDAPIGYIAAAVEWAAAAPDRDWRQWWQGGEDVRLVQFLGKDNVPFHTVTFPATLLGSGLPFKLPDVIKAFNWLTYEGGKFSTSRRRGIFSDAALEALPADTWRWWLAANAPEGSDADFAVERFAAGVNKDLADVLGNLVHRCLTFTATRFDGVVPSDGEPGEAEARLATELESRLQALKAAHEAVEIRKAAAEVRAIWSLANAYLAAQAPWTVIRTDRRRAGVVIRTGINLVRTAAVVAWPFVPVSAERILTALGERNVVPTFPANGWSALTAIGDGRAIEVLPVLFAKISNQALSRIKLRHGGA